MMKKTSWLLTVLVVLPLGIAAHESRPADKPGKESQGHDQHQKHSKKGMHTRQDAMHDPDAAGEPGRVLELTIVRGTLGDEEQTVRVTEGEIVEFRWSSDQALTLHVHGYDIEVPVVANAPAIMRVHAVKTGRFPILNHDGEPPNVLLHLEVLPK
jgi:hypothetical protein